MKRLPVRWTRTARFDLLEITEFIMQDRPRVAQEVGRAILKEAALLSRTPRRGRIVPEFLEHGLSDYRQVLVKPNRIICRVTAEAAYIEAIIDSRRDLLGVLLRRLLR